MYFSPFMLFTKHFYINALKSIYTDIKISKITCNGFTALLLLP